MEVNTSGTDLVFNHVGARGTHGIGFYRFMNKNILAKAVGQARLFVSNMANSVLILFLRNQDGDILQGSGGLCRLCGLFRRYGRHLWYGLLRLRIAGQPCAQCLVDGIFVIDRIVFGFQQGQP